MPTGIRFRAVPNGHEFTSLLLAVLNSDGKGKNIPDESICARVRALNGPIKLTTYVSLTCTNCPDVVQALNAMATLNSRITHETVDGAINQKEVEAMKVQGVPSVFADGKLINVGRSDLGELLSKLEAQYGINEGGVDNSVEKVENQHSSQVFHKNGGAFSTRGGKVIHITGWINSFVKMGKKLISCPRFPR